MSKTLKALGFNPQLTPNFHIDEFKCKDGTGVPWDLIDNVTELAKNLQVLRDSISASISITSGFRTRSHNQSIDGATASQHIEATAADIQVKGFTPKQVAAKIEELIKAGKMVQGGIGIYKTWVHYDVRKTKARWNG